MLWPFGKRNKPEEQTRDVFVAGHSGFRPEPLTISYTKHAQPDPGMAAVSFDTLLLPLYTPIGASQQNRRQFLSAPSNPVVMQLQAIGITTVGNPGNLAGTFVSSPLIDTQSRAGDMQVSIPIPGEFMLGGRRLHT